MGKDVIIACDFPSAKDTLAFLDKFKDEKPFLKIGMELFYASGGDFLKEIKSRGHKIFLDLKLHDIPNTVKSAMAVLAKYDIDMVNVHASGGIDMMKAAYEGFTSVTDKLPLIIAVTQLTSTSQETMNKELLISGDINDVICHYAINTKQAGLNGVVCSPLEVKDVKAACGAEFITVTPGIRFQDDDKNDQARVTTPKIAKTLGSDYIVVGRSITKASDPAVAYKRCINDFVDSMA